MTEETEEAGRAERALAHAAEAEPHLAGADSRMWMDRLDRTYDELREAFAWFVGHGRGADALQFAADLWLFQQKRGRADESRAWLANALASTDAAARTVTRARALYGAGILAFRNLDAAAAQRSFDECLAIAKDQDYVYLIVRATTGLSRLALRRGDTKEVRRLSEEALAVARERGEKADASSPLHMLAAAARVEGDFARAKAFYRENLALTRELGELDTVAVELGNLGALEVLEGNIPEAVPLIRESLELAYKRGNLYLAPYGLVWFGRVAYADGDPARAATLFAAARAQFDATGLAMDPDEAPEYERGLAVIRSALDEAAFSAAWEEGKQMRLDDAVTFALRPR